MLVVIEANEDQNLTTLEAVKAELDIADADTSRDAILEGYIAQASDIIASYCNRTFAIETVEETLRFNQRQSDLMLARYPVTEIVSVNEAGTLLTSQDYDLDKQTGIIDRLTSDGAVCNWPIGKTVIRYKTGFDLPDGLPHGVERACIQLVKQFNAYGDRDPSVRSETDEGVGSTDYFSSDGSGLPPEIEGLIAQHRRPNA